jgi:hypothetical protein
MGVPPILGSPPSFGLYTLLHPSGFQKSIPNAMSKFPELAQNLRNIPRDHFIDLAPTQLINKVAKAASLHSDIRLRHYDRVVEVIGICMAIAS